MNRECRVDDLASHFLGTLGNRFKAQANLFLRAFVSLW